MLTTLRIKNLALAADILLELRPGYNVVTGETGAGKSILIGALNLVLGERADRSLIRSGSDSCTVEAVFDINGLRAPLTRFLDENGLEPCEGGLLVLKRSFSSAGTNRQFINGSPTSLQTLGAIGQWLVDIHGPHDHQSLLQPARQLVILDAFGKLEHLRGRFAHHAGRLRDLETQKSALVVDEKTFAHQLDLLRFQVNEIKAAKLQPDEEAQLEEEFRRASNSAHLLRLSHTVLELLSEDENCLVAQAGLLGRTLQEIQKVDSRAASMVALHEQAASALHELRDQVTSYADRLEIDPVRHQELEERLNLIQGLKRKYGPRLADIIQFGDQAREKLLALEKRDEELIRIEHEMQAVRDELEKTGLELSNQRRKVIPKLCKAVVKQLSDLGFKQSGFEVAISSSSPGAIAASGFDAVEFQFAPNPGESSRPLRAIASSGELARVMLALKTVLAAEDDVPLLVFDEVDANVGGETAHAVADKMRQIAKSRQVLCITHLAPVAAPADVHFAVTKEVEAGRTVSNIQVLDRSARVNEIARMLGGQSAAARKHADELLQQVPSS